MPSYSEDGFSASVPKAYKTRHVVLAKQQAGQEETERLNSKEYGKSGDRAASL